MSIALYRQSRFEKECSFQLDGGTAVKRILLAGFNTVETVALKRNSLGSDATQFRSLYSFFGKNDALSEVMLLPVF